MTESVELCEATVRFDFEQMIKRSEAALVEERKALEITLSNIRQLEGFADMHRRNIAKQEIWLANAHSLLAKRKQIEADAELLRVKH